MKIWVIIENFRELQHNRLQLLKVKAKKSFNPFHNFDILETVVLIKGTLAITYQRNSHTYHLEMCHTSFGRLAKGVAKYGYTSY